MKHLTVDELKIRDEASFRHVGLYASLKEVLRHSRYRFRVLPKGRSLRSDQALLLNLTYWSPEVGGDVLADGGTEADVVAHVAWHHLAAGVLARGAGQGSRQARMYPEALLLGEAIASAFDVYLVGRLLGHASNSRFLRTQVPAMAETAREAGATKSQFKRLLEDLVADPDRAFEQMRSLLCDAGAALFACRDAEEAYGALTKLQGRPLGVLLHRYELSNWVLYARAYASETLGPDARVREVDRALRGDGVVAIDWLTKHWVLPRLG